MNDMTDKSPFIAAIGIGISLLLAVVIGVCAWVGHSRDEAVQSGVVISKTFLPKHVETYAGTGIRTSKYTTYTPTHTKVVGDKWYVTVRGENGRVVAWVIGQGYYDGIKIGDHVTKEQLGAELSSLSAKQLEGE